MELQEAIATAKALILAEAPRSVEAQAQTALALVTLRIQSQGLGVPYSTRGVPVFFFYNKALNSAGRDYVKRKQKAKNPADRLGYWEEFKQAQGYGSSSVNLTYSGRMFRSLTTAYTGVTGTVFSAAILASDAEEAAKVAYNMTRYGDFLAPNAAEAAEVAQVAQVALDRIIQTAFPTT